MRLLFILIATAVFFVNACTPVEEETNTTPVIIEEEPLQEEDFDLLLGFNDKSHDSIGVERLFKLKEDSLLLVKKSWGHHITDPEHNSILVDPSHKELIFKVIRNFKSISSVEGSNIFINILNK